MAKRYKVEDLILRKKMDPELEAADLAAMEAEIARLVERGEIVPEEAEKVLKEVSRYRTVDDFPEVYGEKATPAQAPTSKVRGPKKSPSPKDQGFMKSLSPQDQMRILRRRVRRKQQERLRSDPNFMGSRETLKGANKPAPDWAFADDVQEPVDYGNPKEGPQITDDLRKAKDNTANLDDAWGGRVRQMKKGMRSRTPFETWASKTLKGAGDSVGGAPLVGKPLRGLLRKLSANPKVAGGTLLGGLSAAGTVGAMVLPSMVQGAYDDTRNLYSRMTRGVRADEMSVDEQIAFDQEVEYATRELMRMQEETEAMARINEQRLMQMEPALANQILAGRRLPRGAMVIGGKPRTDLLREFAMQMAQQPTPQGAAPTSEVFP